VTPSTSTAVRAIAWRMVCGGASGRRPAWNWLRASKNRDRTESLRFLAASWAPTRFNSRFAWASACWYSSPELVCPSPRAAERGSIRPTSFAAAASTWAAVRPTASSSAARGTANE